VGASSSTRPALRFRGKSYLGLVLTPVLPIEAWLEDLAELSRRSPGFFSTRSVVVELADPAISPADARAAVAGLEAMGIRVMGIEAARDAVLPPGLPPLLAGGRQTLDVELQDEAKAKAPPPQFLIVDNVRSGQSVVFHHGDVTVVGSVASGSEVIASGSVHVYGTLRGRVIAGAYGDPMARIFCRKLQAEFLAIDAVYLTAEAIDPALAGKPVQIWSEHESIKLSVLR
jgi:septum site-determining protein MinC